MCIGGDMHTMKTLTAKQGFTVQLIVAIVVALIMVIAVAVPIANDVIENQSFTGTDAVIAGIIPTLLLVAAIVYVTRMY